MKRLIQNAITNKAKKLIASHKPLIIGVTGSVGKTSVRNAIASVLSAKYRVGTTIKNYNNEFGVPLTILGAESPGKSILGWLKIFFSTPTQFPEVFVLEYGIDHPGDMKHLCEIATPDIAVMTRISHVHAEHFRSIEELAEEKAVLLEHAKQLVVLNADDLRVLGLEGHAHASILTYGFSSTANVRASNYLLQTREDFSFEPGGHFSTIKADVTTQDGDQLALELQNLLGQHSVSALLPAIAIAKHLGLTHEQILEKLPTTQFEPGRMNPIPGIKGSLIIDSSYNAAPASMEAALEVLRDFRARHSFLVHRSFSEGGSDGGSPVESARRIAVLGHMAELGSYSEQEHRLIGLKVGEIGVDLLLTVGELARDIRRGAIEAGIPQERTQHFDAPADAGRWLDGEIHKGDIVLVKGSQSARTEKVVKDIMAEPLRAPDLLVRQTDYWLDH